MSIGTGLDVAIGLVLTYLLLGMVASALQEYVVGMTNRRGTKLFEAIDSLLADGTKKGDKSSLAELLKNHGLVRPLGADRVPSYVPAANFALALMDCLGRGSQSTAFSRIENGIAALAPSTVKDCLTTYVQRAGNDLDTLQAHIQTWFDDAMDRVSGDYKRWSQRFLLLYGLVFAVALNVDSINTARTLWLEPAVRAALVQSAVGVAAGAAPVDGQTPADPSAAKGRATDALQELQGLPIPIGWSDVHKSEYAASTSNPMTILLGSIFLDGSRGIWRVLGWILTAFGVSMGAPFWFNALQQLLRLRSAGPKPARAVPPTSLQRS